MSLTSVAAVATLGQLGPVEGGVYQELFRESGHEMFAPDNSVCERVFLVDWEYREYFLMFCLGFEKQTSGTVCIIRETPDEHPKWRKFYAFDAAVQPLGVPDDGNCQSAANNNYIRAKKCKITVHYRPLDYAIKEDTEVTSEIDRYVSRVYGSSGEYRTLEKPLLWVTRVGAASDILHSKLIISQQLTMVWQRVPATPTDPFHPPTAANVDTLLGKVNSVTFDGRSPGTVLFASWEPKMIRPTLADNLSGGYVHYWEIAYNFLIRDHGIGANPVDPIDARAGHCYGWDSKAAVPRWDLLTTDGTTSGSRQFEFADLTYLFSFSPVP